MPKKSAITTDHYDPSDGLITGEAESYLFGEALFGGAIKVNSLNPLGGELQTYNLMGGNGSCVSDMFNGLAIPSVLLHIPKFYGGGDDDYSEEEEDNEKEDYGGHKRGGKKQLMHNNPTAGVVSEDLYDKFLKMAQDLDMYKSNRKTKKQPVLLSSKKMKKTRRNK
jgi:hypothetical protein